MMDEILAKAKARAAKAAGKLSKPPTAQKYTHNVLSFSIKLIPKKLLRIEG